MSPPDRAQEDRLAEYEYYDRELRYLRKLGAEFAEQHTNAAKELGLTAEHCHDPHAERLIESVAFLTARIQRKLDEGYPAISESLLRMIYPQYLQPVPSMAIAQFVLDPKQGVSADGHPIDRGATLYAPRAKGVQCRFETCYPVMLWPLAPSAASLEGPHQSPGTPLHRAVLKLELRCLENVPFNKLKLKHLRFFLNGDPLLAYELYDLLFNHLCHIEVSPLSGESDGPTLSLPVSAVQPVGFEKHEDLLPYPLGAFDGYRLIQEYFAFREKFLFFDLCDLTQVVQAGFKKGITIEFFLDRPARAGLFVDADTFRVGCTPIVNLFTENVEAIPLDHLSSEYPLEPNKREKHAREVYCIESVQLYEPKSGATEEVQPFYTSTHETERATQGVFWFATRHRVSGEDVSAAANLSLSLVNSTLETVWKVDKIILVKARCTNGDLPGTLPFGGVRRLSGQDTYAPSDFQLAGEAPVSRIWALTKPTPTRRVPWQKDFQSRLISHLSLNHLSLGQGEAHNLRQLLELYAWAGDEASRKQIAGVRKMTVTSVVRRLPDLSGNGSCRGLQVTVTFDDDQFREGSVYLFASILERVISLYASINSFTEFVARTSRQETPLKQWHPRVGQQWPL